MVQGFDHPASGDRKCLLKIDRTKELVLLPETYLETLDPLPSSLLANDLFLPWDMNDPQPRLEAFVRDKSLAGHILETTMFYDRVIVPTVDFAIIVPLVHWLGVPVLRDMLVSEALSFVRYRGGLAYDGRKDSGLHTFELFPSPDKPDELFWTRAARCPPSEAVSLQLEHRLHGLPEGGINVLGQLAEICTVETSLPEFTQKVEEETYRDILGSDVLADAFDMESSDLKNLPGLQPNQMRIFASLREPSSKGDAIDTTLRLGMLNLEAYLAEEARARDMVTAREFAQVLKAKVRRFTGGRAAYDGFFGITALEGIPEIAGAIAGEEISVAAAWRLREGKSASDFREWFDNVGLDDPASFQKEYVSVLKRGGLWSGTAAKTIRLCVAQVGAMALSAVAGPAVAALTSLGLSAADSLLLDRILEKVRVGKSPRYFIDDVRHKLFE